MATFAKLKWPVVDTAAVCAEQDRGNSGPLILNGNLRNINVPNRISFIDANIIRSVSITSTNNLSNRDFSIIGFQNNAPIQEIIEGPNNTTVYGTKNFDIITSVGVNGSVNNVKVGTGSSGYLPLLVVNNGSSIINYSISVIFPPSGTTNINWSFYRTLDELNNNYISFDNQIGNLFPVTGLVNQTTSKLANSQEIANFVLLKINSSGTPITDTFDFVFLAA